MEAIGITVRTNKPNALKAALYRARHESGIPGLDHLAISTSGSDPNVLLIYRKSLRKPSEFVDAESI